MTPAQFQALQPGDSVRHVYGTAQYMVTANYGDRVTAVRTEDITNPAEWVLVSIVMPRRLTTTPAP